MSIFSIQEDLLLREVANAQKKIQDRKVSLTGIAATSSTHQEDQDTFKVCDLLETELARVSDYIASQQQSLELSAKVLLNSIDAAGLFDHGDVMSNNVHHGALREFQHMAQELVKGCISLHRLTNESKAKLIEIGLFADEKLGTAFQGVLKFRMQGEPWKTGLSSALVVVVSDVYEAIRNLEERQRKNSAKSGGQWIAPSSFERSTTKYWVQEQHLMELLLACASEAPLLVYGKSGRLTDFSGPSTKEDQLWSKLATPITSVYFDSRNMSLYKDRLARREGAQLLRARWYGSKPSGDQIIFLELKTHHEKWINTKSVKERVEIREKDMKAFLKTGREWTLEKAQSMVLAAKPTLADDKLSYAANLLLTMHNLVVKHKLRPCVRSVYLRAAFQSAKGNDLRLTVDRNVTLVDETKNSYPDTWCLPDDALIENTMTTTVPFVVFELKLAGDEGKPPSLQDLENRGFIQEAAKFSKFLTGAAAYNASKISHLPYWADHPSFAPIFRLDKPKSSLPSKRPTIQQNHENAQISTSFTSDTTGTTNSDDENASMDGGSRTKPSKMASIGNLFQRKKSKDKKSTHAIAPKTPVRVEPKSYFANERTFIQWISAGLLLVTISVLLLGYERERGMTSTSDFARNSGVGVCCGAVLIVFYATFVYLRRIRLLSTGSPYGYIDYVGPLVLSVAVMAGVVVLLYEFATDIRGYSTMNIQYLREEPGVCYQHPKTISGVNMIEYQPSAVVVDPKREMLLVASMQQVIGYALSDNSSLGTKNQRILLNIPDTDLEALTLVGDRVFALSEGPTKTELVELGFTLKRTQFSEDVVTVGNTTTTIQLEGVSTGVVSMEVLARWTIMDGDSNAEGLMYVPSSTVGSSNNAEAIGRFYVDMDDRIRIYDVPSTMSAAMNDTATPLQPLSIVDKGVVSKGLSDTKIAAMHYFEGIAYFLHDNDMVIRSWDIERGLLLSEVPVPHVPDGYSNQWEGLALERREPSSDAHTAPRFRGSQKSSSSSSSSSLILHLTLDSPAEVWSILVEEGSTPGIFKFPSCAAAKHYVQPHSTERLA